MAELLERDKQLKEKEQTYYQLGKDTVGVWQPHLAKLTKLVKAYIGVKPDTTAKNEFSHQSASSKKIYNASRLITARLAKAIMASERLLGLRPFRTETGNYGTLSEIEKKAELGMEVANYLLNIINLKKTLINEIIPDINCFGNPILKIAIQEKFNIRYLPYVYRVSPFHAFPDPNASSLDTANFFFELIPITKAQLKYYLQNTPDVIPGCLDKVQFASSYLYDSAEYIDDIRSARKQNTTLSNPYNTNNCAVLMDAWIIDDPFETGEYGVYNILYDYNSGTVIKPISPSPFAHGKLPYVRGNIFPVPESANAMSMAESLYHLQTEYNKYRSQAATNASLAANLAILMSRGAGINIDSLTQNSVGRIIMGNSIGEESVRQLQFRPMLDQIQMLMSYLEGDIQTTSGVTDLMAATSAPSTAKAAEILAVQGQVNTDLYTILLNETLLQPAFEMIWQNIQQFLTTEILTSDGNKINRNDLQGDFQVYVGDLLVKARQETIAKQLTTVMAMFGQAGIPVDYGYLGRIIALGLGCSLEQSEKIFAQTGVTSPKSATGGGVVGQNTPMGMPMPNIQEPSQGQRLEAGDVMDMLGAQNV